MKKISSINMGSVKKTLAEGKNIYEAAFYNIEIKEGNLVGDASFLFSQMEKTPLEMKRIIPKQHGKLFRAALKIKMIKTGEVETKVEKLYYSTSPFNSPIEANSFCLKRIFEGASIKKYKKQVLSDAAVEIFGIPEITINKLFSELQSETEEKYRAFTNQAKNS